MKNKKVSKINKSKNILSLQSSVILLFTSLLPPTPLTTPLTPSLTNLFYRPIPCAAPTPSSTPYYTAVLLLSIYGVGSPTTNALVFC